MTSPSNSPSTPLAGPIQSVITAGAVVAIAAHLIWGWLVPPIPDAPFHYSNLPLLLALTLGGGVLVLGLLSRLVRGEFGSDLLAGLSIVTSLLLGEYLAGTLVVLMLSGGEVLEAYAVRRASSALDALARRLPSVAHCRREGAIKDISLGEVDLGDLVVVFPHETCPVDGVVTEGHGTMDESYLTGEPYPYTICARSDDTRCSSPTSSKSCECMERSHSGLDTIFAPDGSWDDFVQRHAATLWACDFISVRMATLTGFVEVYVLAFLHVGSRRAFVSGFTPHPTAEWVTQQARNASMEMAEWGLTASHLLIDHDTKFVAGFDTVFETEGTEVKRVGPRAPNLNAQVERFIQSVRVECLDHFLVCGEKHLRHILTEYLHYYNELRPHQGMGNVPLPEATESEAPRRALPDRGEVLCHERLGGLLRHYYRAAA